MKMKMIIRLIKDINLLHKQISQRNISEFYNLSFMKMLKKQPKLHLKNFFQTM